MSLPPLPDGLKPLFHQVAGHKYGEGKTGLGCLQSPDGLLLKPVQRPPKGLRELQFYETMFDDKNLDDAALLKLRDFVPKFYGTYQNLDVVYLKLEDCAGYFNKPSIMDIKMGADLYHADYMANHLPKEDVERSFTKYPAGREYGYCILGMRMFDPNLRDFSVVEKAYFKKLHHEEDIISKGLELYFRSAGCCRNALVKSSVEKLQEICDWFEGQSQVIFFSSSLLFVYEGELSGACSSSSKAHQKTCCKGDAKVQSVQEIQRNGEDTQGNGEVSKGLSEHPGSHLNCDSKKCDNTADTHCCSSHRPRQILVKMIDFSHTYFENKRDENYLKGLRTLIKHLKKMLPN